MNLVCIPFVLVTVMTLLPLSRVTYSVEFCAIPLQSQWGMWNYSYAACMHKGLQLCFLTLLYWMDEFMYKLWQTKAKFLTRSIFLFCPSRHVWLQQRPATCARQPTPRCKATRVRRSSSPRPSRWRPPPPSCWWPVRWRLTRTRRLWGGYRYRHCPANVHQYH